MTRPWTALGAVAPGDLAEARLELHYAAWVVAAAGASLLEPRSDDSHPNLGWDGAARVLAGHGLSRERTLRAALDPHALALQVRDDTGPLARLALDGVSLDASTEWLGEALERAGLEVPRAGLHRPEYALSPHALASGASFGTADRAAVHEVAGWIADAAIVLEDVAQHAADASPVRCWPHHFDIATLLTLERDAGGAAARTVGVGLSPGDETIPEPYWYVSPWPYPEPDRLRPLAQDGRWLTQGFTAAVLTGSQTLAAGSGGDAQEARVRAFLGDAVSASRESLQP